MNAYVLTASAAAFVLAFVVARAALGRGASDATAGRSLSGLAAGTPSGLATDLDTRPDAAPFLSRILSGTDMQRQIQLALVRAGYKLRPSELIALSCCGVGLGGGLGYVVARVPGLALGVIVMALLPTAIIRTKVGLRRTAVMHQLAGAMDMICASLRAGYGFPQALRTVGEQVPAPLGLEANRVLDELGVGLSLDQALKRMVMRADQPDVELMCTAVQIQARTGGNLASILETLGGVIRERIKLRGEIDALTAEGRLSAGILIVLPIVLALALNTMNPGWLSPLFNTGIGQIIFGVGLGAFILGILVLHQMLQVDV